MEKTINKQNIIKKPWAEFRNSGLLWFINGILHTFGWAIVFEVDNETKVVTNVYPARVRFRGFSEADNAEGYQRVTNLLKETVNQLDDEVKE